MFGKKESVNEETVEVTEEVEVTPETTKRVGGFDTWWSAVGIKLRKQEHSKVSIMRKACQAGGKGRVPADLEGKTLKEKCESAFG